MTEPTAVQDLECALLTGREIADRLLDASKFPALVAAHPELANLPNREEWVRISATFAMCCVLLEPLKPDPSLRPKPTKS